MEKNDLEKEYILLKEKFIRHQQILIRAYNSIRQKEEALESLNRELKENEKLLKDHIEELQAANEEISSMNEELNIKNRTIEKQNEELRVTMQHLKETQADLLESEKMASLGILTAGVAHEINNPLNYILGAYVGLKNYFKIYPPADEKKINFLLYSIKEGVDRSSKIVTGLNQFSRNVDNNEEICDLHAIIENCLVIINYQIKNKIIIRKNYKENPIIIKGNSGKLHQVFLNIFTNAYQAIENKGEIKILTNTINNNHIIEISDTGIGINKDIINKIKNPFFTTKPPGKGIGLGLSITYNILKKHKAKLSFISEEGKGTTVKITFPVLKERVE